MGRVYTRRGDSGMTDLADGSRVRKDSVRIEAYGTVDELNSHLGLLLASVTDETARNCIVGCQNVLFDIGAVLATADAAVAATMQAVREEDVAELERRMDEWSAVLPGWRGFVLPGGTEAAARAQVCRAVCRRAERRVLELAAEADVPAEVLRYLNRLSDLLFVMALHENFLCHRDEIVWQKRI